MKTAAITMLCLILLVTVTFAVLGVRSRDGEPAGLIDGKLAPCGPSPNCVSSMYPEDREHVIEPLSLVAPGADATWTQLLEGVVAMGGDIQENAPPYLAVTFESAIFGFVDDVECLINQQSGLVHIRSASRVGYSDLDVNRERVEQIRELLTRKPEMEAATDYTRGGPE